MIRALCALLLSTCVFIQAQENTINFTRLSTSDGLSQSSVIALEQDAAGFMWIGTRDGLNHYDGHDFTVYKTQDGNETSLSNSDILSLEVDQNDNLWVGTYNGLNHWNSDLQSFDRYFHSNQPNSLAGNLIHDILATHDGILWIATDAGLSHGDAGDQSIDRSFETVLKGIDVLSVFETRDRKLFAGTAHGFYRISIKNGNYSSTLVTSNTVIVQCIIETSEGHLLLGTKSQGILSYDSAKINNEPLKSINKEPLLDVRDMIYDDQSRLWVGTYDGIVIIDSGTVTSIKSEPGNSKGLRKNSIKTLFKDASKSIWAGTYYGGLHIWNGANNGVVSFIEGSGRSSLNYDVVSAVQADSQSLYIATEQGGLNILDRPTREMSYLYFGNSALKEDNLKSLLLIDGRLWIGSYSSGVAVYNTQNKRFEENLIGQDLKNILNNSGVYDIQHSGDLMFFATFSKGVVVYNRRVMKIMAHYNKSTGLTSDLVRSIYVDQDQSIWIGTQNGLNHISATGSHRSFLFDQNQNSGYDILDVYRDSKDILWVATKSHGLYRLDQGEFLATRLSQGATNFTTVHSIIEGNNSMWLTTNQGVLNYSPENSQLKKRYTIDDGIAGNEFSNGAAVKLNDATIALGGVSGLTLIPVEQLKTDDYAPDVIFVNFKLSNHEQAQFSDDLGEVNLVQKASKVQLKNNQRSFTIQFTMPVYYNATGRSYRYRLKGLEEDWKTTRDNVVGYTIQEAGSYTFEVQGVNADGLLSKEISLLEIDALPAPWFSWWAYVLYSFVVVIAVLFLIRNFRIRTQLKESVKFEQKEQEQIKAVNESKLQFFTNISHEFRTPLTLILGPLQQILENYQGSHKTYKRLLVVESNANQLLRLINRLMDFRKLEQQQFKLECAQGNMIKFLKEIYLSFSEHARVGDYEYDFITSDEEILVYYDRSKLERVFYNLISNAFKFTPVGGKIEVIVERKSLEILIHIKDSGIGVTEQDKSKVFDRFYEGAVDHGRLRSLEKSSNYARQQGTGIGLNIAKKHSPTAQRKDHLDQ
jgi:signal transduction histidine kinase/ligand-binding sensor domain-containing protein